MDIDLDFDMDFHDNVDSFMANEDESVRHVDYDPVAVEEAEMALLATTLASSKIEAVHRNITKREMALNTFDSYISSLENSLESLDSYGDASQGISQEAADVLNISVESICEVIGFSDNSIMPSVESYEYESDRANATEVALEAIRDKATNLATGIRNVLKAIMRKIKQMITSFMNNAESISKGAASLLSKVNDLEGKPTGKLPEKFNKVFAGTDPKKALGSANDLLSSSSKVVRRLSDGHKALTKMAESGNVKSFLSVMNDAANAAGASNDDSIVKGLKVKLGLTEKSEFKAKTISGLINGKAMSIAVNTKTEKDAKWFFKSSIVKNESVKADDQEVLSVREMKGVLKSISKLDKGAFKDILEAVSKLEKSYDKVLADQINTARSAEESTSAVSAAVRDVSKASQSLAVGSISNYSKTASAVMSAVKASMKTAESK